MSSCWMLFADAPLGSRFRYPESRDPGPGWVKIGSNLIAEYDPRYVLDNSWIGQKVCCFADTDEQAGTMLVEVFR